MFEPDTTSDNISTKDKLLATPAVISGLLCLGLSFGLRQALYRERFFWCLGICVLSFLFTDRKRVLVGAFIGFLLIRSIWSLSLLLLRPK